jgi:hypothetical protein
MTGFDSKRKIALDRLDDDDIQVYAQSDLKGESMTKDKALTLEALKYAASMGHRLIGNFGPFTIKSTLAQPVQEPLPVQPAQAATRIAILEAALNEIAYAGMSASPEMSEHGRQAWHASQAWKFIGIAAQAIDQKLAPEQKRCCYHDSDCAMHNMPAYPAGPCDCSLAAQPPLPVQEPIADVRGLLAARLTCWHRLTGVESDELVALFQAQPVQPVQEPVAWAIYDKRGGSKSLHWPENHSPNGDATKFDAVPLYATPPQRPWVGLTEEEVNTLWGEWKDAVCLDYKTWAQAIEARLKENNK